MEVCLCAVCRVANKRANVECVCGDDKEGRPDPTFDRKPTELI